MKAKTIIQKKVMAMVPKLPEITTKQTEWGYEKCSPHYFSISRKKHYCLECGYVWKTTNSGMMLSKIDAKTICPQCNRKLTQIESKTIRSNKTYYGIITTHSGWQVIRMFLIHKMLKKGHPACYSIQEVMQHWINSNGKSIHVEKQVNGLSSYVDAWVTHSEFGIGTKSSKGDYRRSFVAQKYYPKKKVLPIIKRNGFKGYFFNTIPQEFFSQILKNPVYETLVKTKQKSLLEYYNSKKDEILKYWPSIKICIRNNYHIADVPIYLDYLALLEFHYKDLHNPFYVCPKDLNKAHDYLVKKKIQEISQIENKEYQKAKKKFFNLIFVKDDIVIEPLKSIEEFALEGEVLKHCVFANKYFNKENSLILSAKLEGKHLETIEFSLNDLKVVQSRGCNNKSTAYNKQIINLVNHNKNKIIKCKAI